MPKAIPIKRSERGRDGGESASAEAAEHDEPFIIKPLMRRITAASGVLLWSVVSK